MSYILLLYYRLIAVRMECGSCRKVLATINEFIFFVKGDKVSDPTPFLEKFAKTAGNSFVANVKCEHFS